MCYILNIESSSTNCSVSLSKNGELLSLKEKNNEKYSHSTKLHSYIDGVLKQQNIDIKDLSAIAVSKGPGSYTGLRIGVAAAKGLCFSLDIPLISISTLLVLSKKIKIDSLSSASTMRQKKCNKCIKLKSLIDKPIETNPKKDKKLIDK